MNLKILISKGLKESMTVKDVFIRNFKMRFLNVTGITKRR